MIVYKNSAKGFKDDVSSNNIVNKVEILYQMKVGRRPAPNERKSWRESLNFMEHIVRRSEVSDDCGILLEYIVPSTNNRIDFLIAGKDDNNNDNFVVVELKQWDKAEKTLKDGIVETFLGGGQRETTHPSYQAFSYKTFIKDYNEEIESGEISAHSCAYLHNYTENHPEPLLDDIYDKIVDDSPIYFKDDQEKFENFLKKYVGRGDGLNILYRIETGKIKPTKKLIDHVTSLFEGNQDFILLDEQKIAFELAYEKVKNNDEKSVVLIKGGPGTGKSVISMNLVAKLLKDELLVQFVAPNSSFRSVMINKLAKKNSKTRLTSIFRGSAGYVDSKENTFDAIVVDEAHRLKDKTAYQYYGENQVEDIVKASKCSIFFVDDNQVIRPEDIGNTTEIKRVANKFSAKVYEIDLIAQFRCSGAEGYINWVDDILQIKQTANFDGWNKGEYDFKIFDNPNTLKEEIKKKTNAGLSARILSGYAWEWTGAKGGNSDSQIADIKIADFNFEMPWNSRKVGTTWAVEDSADEQIGCIHTSQGLEFDYVGVIVGNDLRFNPETLSYFTNWHEYKDMNGKKGLRNDPERLNKLVRNIYKILMTRGMKGCYVYFMDKGVEKYFRGRTIRN